MKAILITRCGCSRMAEVEVQGVVAEIRVPMISREQDITDIVPAVGPVDIGAEFRSFGRSGSLMVPGLGNLPIYKEI